MARRSDNPAKTTLAVSALLVILVLLPFAQVLRHDFVTLDDPTYVTENEEVKGGITLAGLRWALTAVRGSNWHPLTWMSHMLDYQLFGPRPMGHHLVSLLLHVANVVLLFLVLRRMTGAVWRSAFVAALFGVHPLHVESVAWIAERKDVLSTLLWLLTISAYVRYVRTPGIVTYVPVLLLFALGLTSKPMLVTLPFVLLLLDYWPLGRTGLTRCSSIVAPSGTSGRMSTSLVIEKVPLLLLSAASCMVTFLAQSQGGAVRTLEHFPLGIRAANAVVADASYLLRMLWPQPLIVFWPHPGAGLPVWQVVASGLALVLVTGSVVLARRSRPYLVVGWFWYLGTLVPVIGLVQVGMQAMADRYTYITLIGLFVVVAWGVPELVGCLRQSGQWLMVNGKWRVPASTINHQPSTISHSPILPLTAILTIAALMIATWTQVRYWKDSFTLFRHALAVSPGNAVAHYNLGVELVKKGDERAAMAEFQEALRIKRGYPDAWHNVGVLLQKQGRIDEAIECYSRALELDPALSQARNNLAITLFLKGDYAGAWREVHGCISRGFEPHPGFLEALSEQMPEPREP